MKKPFLARYFFASALLLLVLASIYVFSESRRLRQELLRQTEAKGSSLAEAMETGAKNAILGNSLLEDLVSQRLLDNARLIDRLLMTRPLDQDLLDDISAMNRLQKVEFLDFQGEPLKLPVEAFMPREMREIMADMHDSMPEELRGRHGQMIIFMWGRRWALPWEKEKNPDQPPPYLRERKFWEGSLFGVAVNAQSFPGIIAVHAKADYILNFKKEIGVQHQIEELGRQPDIDYVALLDNQFTIVAHTDPKLVGTQEQDGFVWDAQGIGETQTRILRGNGAHGRYELIKAIRVNQSPLGFLKIGLSLEPMEIAWRQSLRSVIVLSLAILALGLLGMGAIFYNQQSHMERIRTLEGEVARQERLSAMGNLAATVAHEIRNPLNAISMGLQRLKAEFQPTQDEDQYSRFIDLTQSEVRRLNSIVEQFLSLARPLDLKPDVVHVEQLLSELATFVEGDAERSKVKIKVSTSADLPSLKADRNYLKQLLLNLVLNGMQAMPDGGTLTLEAARSRSHLLLSVTDTGTGIPKEMIPKIFEPYFTSKSNGSGLGLPIARRIAEAHSGALTVESQSGNGSRFQVALPWEGPEG